MSPRVAIIDSGGANIASLSAALDRLGASSLLTSSAEDLRSASHVILPGVGAAADAMRRLTQKNLVQVIPELSQPVLGICLGLHLLAERSEENGATCLGILPAEAKKLQGSPALPVPNMGWCPVIRLTDHALFDGIDSGTYFYFVHSYALAVGGYSVAAATHGEPMTAVAASGNFVATQFHPERSASAGARLLANFLAMH